MAVTSISGGSTQPTIVDKDKTGFNGLTSDTFLKLLITQLQNQDPTQPVGNEELLQQLSSMRNLQANLELSDTLKGLASNQNVSAGAAFLGKVITGQNANRVEVTGVADRVFVREGKLIIGMGTDEVDVSDVTGVRLAPAA